MSGEQGSERTIPPSAGAERWTGVPPATWSALEAIPVFLVSVLLAALVSVSLAAWLASASERFLAGEIAGEAAFVAGVVLWMKVVDRAPLAALGAPRRPVSDVLIGMGCGVGLVVAGYLSLYVVYAVATAITGHRPAEPEQIPTYVQGLPFALLAPVVILAAPIGEETFFRGFLYRGLRRAMPIWASAIVSGGAFALVHVTPVLILALFPVGIGLALVYEWRGSLAASISAHATFNLIGFVLIVAGRR